MPAPKGFVFAVTSGMAVRRPRSRGRQFAEALKSDRGFFAYIPSSEVGAGAPAGLTKVHPASSVTTTAPKD